MLQRTGNISIPACGLCGSSQQLQHSHIIPHFVFEWLKRTSGTGYLRLGSNPNKREQDGFKEYLLCAKCESLFSTWEKAFAEQLFVPLHEQGVHYCQYGEWLGKFCASIVWRVLFLHRQLGMNHLTSPLRAKVDEAIESWRSFILGQCASTGSFQLHLLPVGPLSEESSLAGTPPNMNRYLLRAIEFDVPANNANAFVYAKLGQAIIVGFIQFACPEEWRGTRVSLKRGTIRPRKYKVPGQFGEYLNQRATNFASIQSNLSDKQKSKVSECVDRDPDRFANSETFSALIRDVELFGPSALSKEG